MSIRLKIILVVLPLIVATLGLTGVASYFSATNGISRVAREFLDFKATELSRQAQSQWSLLVENGLTGRPRMVDATKEAVASYARSMVRSATECIVAFTADGAVAMSTSAVAPLATERPAIAALAAARSADYVTLPLAGVDRVGEGFWFEPFGWYFLVTEERSAFYSDVNRITVRTLAIMGGAIAAAVALLLAFVGWLTRPLTRVVGAMREIISTSDLSARVRVQYPDEIGTLSQTFNVMVENLGGAYERVRRFALDALVGELREKRLRTLFGRFVPEQVIEEFFANPEASLVGENRPLAILFSDIRSFTTISEQMRSPADLVLSLNRYFERMVGAIHDRGGRVEKYIGDAIKAFFGATAAAGEPFARQAVEAAFDMAERLVGFNREQSAAGRPEFRNGVGLSCGVVTIGNIGTDRKKEYSVIGGTVNLAEELESLTKTYRQPLVMSEAMHDAVGDGVACRLLDVIAVAGQPAMRIYTARRGLEAREQEAWQLASLAMEQYLGRRFAEAGRSFGEVLRLAPGDAPAELLAARCAEFAASPPPAEWSGAALEHAP